VKHALVDAAIALDPKAIRHYMRRSTDCPRMPWAARRPPIAGGSMKPSVCLAALLLMSGTIGCVERRFTIYSEPAGALVYHNGRYLGVTPVDGYLIYYGKQQFRILKEGYETLDVVQEYWPPWYELPGIDFVAENLYPGKLRDVRRFCYQLRPLQSIPPDDVRMRAEQLRSLGQNIGVPAPPRPLGPAPGAAAPAAPQGAAVGPPAPQGSSLPPPRPVPTPPPPAGVSGPSP
jgi:hypothetical protein